MTNGTAGMNRTAALFAAALALLAARTALADTYACADTGIGGFEGRTGTYAAADLAKAAFTLEADWRAGTVTQRIAGASMLDAVATTYRCRVPYPDGEPALWQCDGDFRQLSFNAVSGRYVRTATFGHAAARGGDPIFVAYGACERK